jgi:hypothetical protein
MDRAFGRQDLQQCPIDVIQIRYPEHFSDLYCTVPPDTAGRERAE